MTDWTAPSSADALTSGDISNILAGLRGPDSRDNAHAFIDTITEPAYLYVIAAEIGDEDSRPGPHAAADAYRQFIHAVFKETA